MKVCNGGIEDFNFSIVRKNRYQLTGASINKYFGDKCLCVRFVCCRSFFLLDISQTSDCTCRRNCGLGNKEHSKRLARLR